jgi:hypothetical protein
VTSAILFRGFPVKDFVTGLTLILGFLVIVIGVALLFQFNLKLHKLTVAKASENGTIDELNDETHDKDPLVMWVEAFPVNKQIHQNRMIQRRNTSPADLENANIGTTINNEIPKQRASPTDIDSVNPV